MMMRGTSIAVIDVANFFQAAWESVDSKLVFSRESCVVYPTVFNSILKKRSDPDLRFIRSVWFDGTQGGISRFHETVERSPRCTLQLGRIRNQKQSRVDSMIVRHMLTLARNQACEQIILVSADGDLLPGVEEVKECGIVVTICHMDPLSERVSSELLAEADDTISISSEEVFSFLRKASDSDQAVMLERVCNIVEEVLRMATPEEIRSVASKGKIPGNLDRELLIRFSKMSGRTELHNENKTLIRKMFERSAREQVERAA